MDKIIWVWPYIIVLVVISAIILYLRRSLIRDTIKKVHVGDIYIDPECNRVNSKFTYKWMEYKVIEKTNDFIICEHYWRYSNKNKNKNIFSSNVCVTFTYKEFFYKFKRYEI